MIHSGLKKLISAMLGSNELSWKRLAAYMGVTKPLSSFFGQNMFLAKAVTMD